MPGAPPLTAAPASDADGAPRRGPMRPAQLAPVRTRLSGAELSGLFRTLDAAAAAAAVAVTAATAGALALQPVGEIAPMLTVAALALWMLGALDGYAFRPREAWWMQALRVLAASLAGAAAGMLLASMIPAGAPAQAGRAALWVAIALTLSHLWGWVRVRRWRLQGRLTPNIVVVGATEAAGRLIARALETREVNILGVFDDRAARSPDAVKGVPVLGGVSALMDHKVLPYVDRIVITVPPTAQARVRMLIERLRVLPNVVTLFVEPVGDDPNASSRTLSSLADSPLAAVSGHTVESRAATAKRLQDLVVSFLGLVAASPLMAAVAIAVRLDSPGPILFRQRRHGFNHETITVLKFRSMRQEASDATASRQVSAGDDRVTKVGRFIRKTSLDELPQLLNVLSGEMSLVGPRPHAIGMKTAGEESHRLVAEYAWRHRVKPGITGWAQINGSRGPVDTAEAVRERVAYDIAYIERQSFWFDLYILLMTVPRLLGDRHAVR